MITPFAFNYLSNSLLDSFIMLKLTNNHHKESVPPTLKAPVTSSEIRYVLWYCDVHHIQHSPDWLDYNYLGSLYLQHFSETLTMILYSRPLFMILLLSLHSIRLKILHVEFQTIAFSYWYIITAFPIIRLITISWGGLWFLFSQR